MFCVNTLAKIQSYMLEGTDLTTAIFNINDFRPSIALLLLTLVVFVVCPVGGGRGGGGGVARS